jgi:hypothetical protein
MEDGFAYSSSTLILVLALATLCLGVAFGIYQRMRVSKAKRTHEHSALSSDPRLQNDHPAAQEARRRS